MSTDAIAEERKPSGKVRQRNIRVKKATSEDEGPLTVNGVEGAEDGAVGEVQRDKLEQMKLLQKIRKRAGGTSAHSLAHAVVDEFPDDEPEPAERETQLMGTFSKATAVVTTEEDPNMAKFIEQELAKRLGKRTGPGEVDEDPETKRRRLEAEMYQIPDQYKTSLVGDTVVPGMNTIMTEVALSADVKLRNIEEVESMKRRLLGGDVDIRQQPQSASSLRKHFVAGFGRQTKKSNLDREAAEEQAKRMRHISEKRAAVPTHRLDRS